MLGDTLAPFLSGAALSAAQIEDLRQRLNVLDNVATATGGWIGPDGTPQFLNGIYSGMFANNLGQFGVSGFGFYSGTGNPYGADFTGAGMVYPGYYDADSDDYYCFYTLNNGSLQVGLSTSGQLIAGGGNVGMNEDGLWIIGSLTPSTPNKFIFYESDGTTEIASIYPTQSPDSPTIYDLKISVANPGGNLILDSGISLTNIDKIVVGTDEDYATWGSNSETGPGVFVQKTYNAGGTNEHGIIVADVFTNNSYAYAGFDAQFELTGSNAFDHSTAYQARPKYTATGYTGSMGSFVSAPDVTAGQVGTYKHFGMATTNASTNINHEYGLCLTNFTGYGDAWPIYVETARNETVYLSRMLNTSANAAARSLSYWGESANRYIGLQYENSGRATIPNTGILKTGGSSTGGIIIQTNAAGAPIVIEVNATEVGRWSATGLGIGRTPSYALDVNTSGFARTAFAVGTYNSNVPGIAGWAFSVGQADQVAYFMAAAPSSATTGRVFAIATAGESYSRIMYYASGVQGFGGGAATRDTFLGRSAAGKLKIGTTYNLSALGDLEVGTLIPTAITGWAIGTNVQAWDTDLDWLASNITAAGKAILDDATAVAQRTTLGFADGTYSPSATGIANVDSVSAATCQYMRVGNTVTVSGYITVDPTTSATLTQCRISLPIASTFAAAEQCGGSGGGAIGTVFGYVVADTTNHEAIFSFLSSGTTSMTFAFSFTYLIV
jgi:hypothetical protein